MRLLQSLNIFSIYLTLEVSKFLKFIDIKDMQPINIPHIPIMDFLWKLDKSIYVIELQF